MKKITLILGLVLCFWSAGLSQSYGQNNLSLDLQNNGDIQRLSLANEVILNTDWTISAWVKVATPLEGAVLSDKILFSKGGVDKIKITNEGKVQLVMLESGIHSTPSTLTGVTKLETDRWYHISIANKSLGSVTIYINGKSEVTGSAGQFSFNSIGDNLEPFIGELDEVAIFNNCLTASDIRDQLLFKEVNTKTASLILYYNFNDDEQGNSTILDLSKSLNIATVLNNVGITGRAVLAESGAWETPISLPASNLLTNGFTANYRGARYMVLQVATDPTFAKTLLTKDMLSITNYELDSTKDGFRIQPNTTYYYRLSCQFPINNGNWSLPEKLITASAVPGNALQLGGGSTNNERYVQIPTDPRLSGAALSKFTVEAWVLNNNPGSALPSELAPIIGSISKIEVETTPILALTGEGYGKVSYGYSSHYGVSFVGETTDLVIEKDEWTHIAMSYDGEIIRLYVNGIEKGNVVATEPPNKESFLGLIGKSWIKDVRSVESDKVFNGQIDEVRVWNYARSPSELNESIYTEIDVVSEGLILYYRMSQTSGNSVMDYSQNKINGNFVDAPGSTFNPYKRSYAMVRPRLRPLSAMTDTSFSFNWSSPLLGTANPPSKYLLTLTNSDNVIVSTAIVNAPTTTYKFTGLTPGKFYCKVSATNNNVDKDSGYAVNTLLKSTPSPVQYVYLGKTKSPGNRLFFSGENNNYLQLSKNKNLNFGSNSFSIEFWMKSGFLSTKQNGHNIDPAPQIILADKIWTATPLQGTPGFMIGIDQNTGKLQFNIQNITLSSNEIVTNNQWNHVACIFDQSSKLMQVFVNGGEPTEQEVISPGNLNTTNPIYIGSSMPYSNLTSRTTYRGELDELKFWSGKRSIAQIRENMNKEIPYSEYPAELVSYFQFDETVGTQATNQIADSNGLVAPAANFSPDFKSDGYYKTWDKSYAMGVIPPLLLINQNNSEINVKWIKPLTLNPTSYTITVATDIEFKHILPAYQKPVNVGLADNYSITGLTPGVPYFVRVNAEGTEVLATERKIINDFTLVASPLVFAQPGKAIEFSGNNFIEVSPVVSERSTKYTFDTWCKIDDSVTNGKMVLFQTKSQIANPNNNLVIGIELTNGVAKPFINWFGKETIVSGGNLDLPIGEWFHFAFGFDGTNDAISFSPKYSVWVTKNGEIPQSFTSSINAITANEMTLYDAVYLAGFPTELSVAADYTGFTGILDETHFWKELLTTQKVSQLATSPMKISNPIGNLLLSFQMDQPATSLYTIEQKSFVQAKLGSNNNVMPTTGVTSGAFFNKPILTPVTNLGINSFTVNWLEVIGYNAATSKLVLELYNYADINSTSTSFYKSYPITNFTDISYHVTGLAYGTYEIILKVIESDQEIVADYPATTYINSSDKLMVSTITNAPGYAFVKNSADLNAIKNAEFSMTKSIFGITPSAFTIEYWMRADAVVGELFKLSILSTNNEPSLTIFNNNRGLSISNGATTITTDNFIENLPPPPPITTGVWQHVALSYDNEAVNLYKNGRLVQVIPLKITKDFGQLTFEKIAGAIDEFRIWGAALTAAEINENINKAVNPTSDNLLLYYTFDYLSAYKRDIIDLTGSGKEAKITEGSFEPSFAMIAPLSLSVDQVEGANQEYTFRWKKSEISPIISSSANYEFYLELSTDINFSGTIAITQFLLNNMSYTYDSLTGFFTASFDTGIINTTGFYARISQIDTITGNFPPSVAENAEQDRWSNKILKYSNYSNIAQYVPDGDRMVAPGNMLMTSKYWRSIGEISKSNIPNLMNKERQMTLEFWFKTQQADTIIPLIASKRLGHDIEKGFNIFLENGKPTFQMGNGIEGKKMQINIVTNNNRWHHFAVTYDNNSLSGYLNGGTDGRPNSTITIAEFNPSNGKTTIVIGQDTSYVYPTTYYGCIDEFRAWSVAKTASEIRRYMIEEVDSKDEKLFGYYSFDQKDGYIFFDSSQYASNGNVIGYDFDIWHQSNAMGCIDAVVSSATTSTLNLSWTKSSVPQAFRAEYSIIVNKDADFAGHGLVYPVGDSDTQFTISSVEQDTSLLEGETLFYKTEIKYNFDNGPSLIRTSAPKSAGTKVKHNEAGNGFIFNPNTIPINFEDMRYSSQRLFTRSLVTDANSFKSPHMTVGLWFKPRKLGVNAKLGTILKLFDKFTVYTNEINANSFVLRTVNSTGNGYNHVNTAGNGSSAELVENRWHYLGLIFTESSVRVYLNDVYLSTHTGDFRYKPSNVNDVTAGLRIGWDGYIGNNTNLNEDKRFFIGEIDEIRIWNHLKTEIDLKQNARYELNPNEEGLVGYYKVNNTNGNWSADSSGRYNNLYTLKASGDTIAPAEMALSWTTSYSLGTPDVRFPLNVTYSAFTARFEAPLIIVKGRTFPKEYILEISKNNDFTAFDSNSLTPANLSDYTYLINRYTKGTNAEKRELLSGNVYYYRAKYKLDNGDFRTSEPEIVTTLMSAPGNCLEFKDNRVNLGCMDLGANQSELVSNNLPSYTIMFWIRSNEVDNNGFLTNNNPNALIISGSDANNAVNAVTTPTIRITNSSNLRFGHNTTDYNNNLIQNIFTDVRWYHVALTYGSIGGVPQYKLYVDGKLISTFNSVGGIPTGTNQIRYVGGLANATAPADNYFSGMLDELRIYKGALSQQEIINDTFKQILPTYPSDIISTNKEGADGYSLLYYFQFNQGDPNNLITDVYTTPINGQDPKIAKLRSVAAEDPQIKIPIFVKNNGYTLAGSISDIGANVRTNYGTTNAYYKLSSYYPSEEISFIDEESLVTNIGEGFKLSNIWRELRVDPRNEENIQNNVSLNSRYLNSVLPIDFLNMRDQGNNANRMEFIVTGLAIDPLDTFNKTLTTLIGIDFATMKTKQILKQSMFTQYNFQYSVLDVNTYAAIELEFDLTKIAPVIYDINYIGEDFTGLTAIEKDAIRTRVVTATAEDFQILWSPTPVINNGTYIDMTLRSRSLQDGVVVTDKTSNARNIFKDERDPYVIRARIRPDSLVKGGILYPGGYFTLGSSIPLDEAIITPAIDFESTVTIKNGTAIIDWKVGKEIGVLYYIVERKNANGVWEEIKVIVPNGINIYQFIDEQYQDGYEYRIVVIDVFGIRQTFPTQDSVKQSWFINLHNGWNLISLPCTDCDTRDLLDIADGRVWDWNGTNYLPIENIDDVGLKGFWIYNEYSNREVEITGKKIASDEIELDIGWNLFGPKENCYAPIDQVESIFAWDKDGSYKDLFNEKNILLSTRAYWFFNTELGKKIKLSN